MRRRPAGTTSAPALCTTSTGACGTSTALARVSFNGNEYVFTDTGEQLTKDGPAWRVGQVFKAAGLPAPDPHTMRHSIADDQDVPHRKIADMMGHRDITTFQRVYRHNLRPVVTVTADLMDRIWEKTD